MGITPQQILYSKSLKNNSKWYDILLYGTLVLLVGRLRVGESLCGVVAREPDYYFVLSEFEPQLRYYVHFRPNAFGKNLEPLILPQLWVK